MPQGPSQTGGTWGLILARIFLVAIFLIFLVPLYWMFITSLKFSPELILSPPTLIPEARQWSSYAEAVTQIPFFTYFTNTILITVLGTIGSVVSNFVVACGFACVEWKGRDKVFYLVLATLFIPFPVAIIPSFDPFAWPGWINTYLPLVVPHFLASAFYIFLLKQFLMQISKEQLDAARIDGASNWRIMWQIVFPLAKPAVMTVAIFTAVGIWNDFLGPLIYLQDTSTQTLSNRTAVVPCGDRHLLERLHGRLGVDHSAAGDPFLRLRAVLHSRHDSRELPLSVPDRD